MYVRTYVCMYDVHICACMYVHMCACMYVHICACVYIHCVHACLRTYECMCVRTYVCMYVYVHMCATTHCNAQAPAHICTPCTMMQRTSSSGAHYVLVAVCTCSVYLQCVLATALVRARHAWCNSINGKHTYYYLLLVSASM